MIKLNKQMLKGEKGITLTSLVIYIIVFVIIIATVAIIYGVNKDFRNFMDKYVLGNKRFT